VEFGIQFIPDVKPSETTAEEYFAESLQLCEDAEAGGFTHVRTVEHYFHYYGGYSPNPIVFLAAVSQRTKRMRLVTGAVIPAFNHPLKVAGEIGMLDGLSHGRLDVGFARAYLPHEFRRFGVSPNESVARYREGIEQIDLLLREEDVTHRGQFHTIENTTSLPRPVQKPRPKFYVAALNTPESFSFAGKMGYSVMAIPMIGAKMRELLGAYRTAWKDAGHPGNGEVMLAFHMYCHEDGEHARRTCKDRIAAYLGSLVEAASDWTQGLSSADYPGYDKIIEKIQASSMETLIRDGAAWIGSPAELRETIGRLQDEYGGFEHASLQVNFNTLRYGLAAPSLKLFCEAVVPEFSKTRVAS